jgi:DNA-binding protein HU-beta
VRKILALWAEIAGSAGGASLTAIGARASITTNFRAICRSGMCAPLRCGHEQRAPALGDVMAEARRMGKSELFSHFAERFEVKRTQAREFFDELTTLAEKELKRSGEFVLPGMVKLVVQKRKARMGRNPATGEAIKIPAKTVVKARIAKQLKDTVLPKK